MERVPDLVPTESRQRLEAHGVCLSTELLCDYARVAAELHAAGNGTALQPFLRFACDHHPTTPVFRVAPDAWRELERRCPALLAPCAVSLLRGRLTCCVYERGGFNFL